MLNETTLQTVIAAKISAELHHAKTITRSLSLSSKNLRILAKRIGERAAGLDVLATYYDEYSKAIIALADHVSKLTNQAANRTVKEWRYSIYEEKLAVACKKIGDLPVPEKIIAVLNEKPNRELQNTTYMSHFNSELQDLLAAMQKNIRSIAVIAVNSKIEAPKTGEYSPVLLDMAQNAEQMIQKILIHIKTATELLSET